MGVTITPEMMSAFADELEKTAFLGKIHGWLGKARKAVIPGPGSLTALAKRLEHPIEGLQEGWRHMTPRLRLRTDPKGWREAAPHLRKHVHDNIRLFGREGTLYGTGAKGVNNRVKATAEELSRRGWTGEGGITKYVPIGGKSITTGFALSGIPSVVNAQKATPTGEGGALEHGIGETAGNLGFVLGSGLHPVIGLGTMMAGQYAGEKAGRILDRLRSGANLRTAVGAPSPTEAQEQISNIQKYYR